MLAVSTATQCNAARQTLAHVACVFGLHCASHVYGAACHTSVVMSTLQNHMLKGSRHCLLSPAMDRTAARPQSALNQASLPLP
jgi:hypothetical protein